MCWSRTPTPSAMWSGCCLLYTSQVFGNVDHFHVLRINAAQGFIIGHADIEIVTIQIFRKVYEVARAGSCLLYTSNLVGFVSATWQADTLAVLVNVIFLFGFRCPCAAVSYTHLSARRLQASFPAWSLSRQR